MFLELSQDEFKKLVLDSQVEFDEVFKSVMDNMLELKEELIKIQSEIKVNKNVAGKKMS